MLWMLDNAQPRGSGVREVFQKGMQGRRVGDGKYQQNDVKRGAERVKETVKASTREKLLPGAARQEQESWPGNLEPRRCGMSPLFWALAALIRPSQPPTGLSAMVAATNSPPVSPPQRRLPDDNTCTDAVYPKSRVFAPASTEIQTFSSVPEQSPSHRYRVPEQIILRPAGQRAMIQ
ncbi:hypothetical protein VTN00DRAFT_1408 [Thermoascus crustaceus]|uniref:uncharacterized protein n=1 Tax=Thermoascus crustaceus TaxID=5088 RepID=UPI003742A2D5